jgi:enoyl-CoA hydratase
MSELELVLESPPQGDADGVALSRAGAVAVVGLCRPAAHNAVTLAGWRRIESVFASLGVEPDVRAVVVRGAGDRAFAAGADIAEFVHARMTAADALVYNDAIARALKAVMSCPKPVIGMVHGLAVGGGCELAAACDVRVASADARFGIPIGRLGVTLGYTEAQALARLIGPGRLKDLLFTGRLIDAQEALAIGLVDRVVAPEDLVAATLTMLGAIIDASQTTIRAAKLVVDMCGRALTEADASALTELTLAAYDGPELKEGVAAFLEKREPRFADAREASDHARA